MKNAAILLALWATFASATWAGDLTALGGTGFKAKSMSAASPGVTRNVQAPFMAGARDPILEMLLGTEPAPPGLRGACEHSTSDLCYDLSDRRIVYRPVRQYMPKLDGLTAENVSLRRDMIRFKYSFR